MQDCLLRIEQFGGDQHWCAIQKFYFKYSTMTLSDAELTKFAEKRAKQGVEEYAQWAREIWAQLPAALAYTVPAGFVSAGVQVTAAASEDMASAEEARATEQRSGAADGQQGDGETAGAQPVADDEDE